MKAGLGVEKGITMERPGLGVGWSVKGYCMGSAVEENLGGGVRER